jgi:hypothetical protein
VDLFDLLPPELFKPITDYLDNRDRLFARSVCKNWLNEFNTDHINIHLLLPQNIPEIVEHFKNKEKINLTVHKSDKCSGTQLHNFINSLPNLTSIELRWLYNGRPSIGKLHLGFFRNLHSLILPTSQVSITEEFSHLTYLDIQSLTVSPLKALLPKLEVFNGPMTERNMSIINPDTLTRLVVKNISDEYTTDVSFNRFSRLKHLDARGIDAHYSTPEGPFTSSTPRNPLQLELPFLEELLVEMDFSLTSTRLTRLTTRFPGNFDRAKLKSLTVMDTQLHKHLVRDFPQLEELNTKGYVFNEQFVNFSNSKLTKLSLIYADQSVQKAIAKLENLRELYLDAGLTSTEYLSGPSTLEKLTIVQATIIDVEWISSLTKLTSLELRLPSQHQGALSIETLTKLKVLSVPMHLKMNITGIEFLTNMERLEVPYVNDEALQSLVKLTRLMCCQVDTCHQVSNLTRLRDLDYCFKNDEDIIGLTNLQHLTYLICRTKSCNTVHLTLLTSLQSIALSSNISERSDWRVVPWSKYNERYEITSKLPHVILSMK